MLISLVKLMIGSSSRAILFITTITVTVVSILFISLSLEKFWLVINISRYS